MEQNALALEYQAEYGRARRNLSLADVVNNPNASRVVRVFGPGFLEQVLDLPIFQSCPFTDDKIRFCFGPQERIVIVLVRVFLPVESVQAYQTQRRET